MFKFSLFIEGPPGSRKSTFLNELKAWIRTQKHITYKSGDADKHELIIEYTEGDLK